MSRKPPALALWLLTRLLTGPNREALIGDLVERHARGSSSTRFWKEALVALGAAAAEDFRARYGVVITIAFFVGFASAAALGTVKTFPGLALFDASLEAFGAGWLVCRFGGITCAFTFATLAGVRELPLLYAAVMAVLDHFGGLWFITHHGMNALPESWLWTAACILAGGVAAARPRQDTPAPTPAAR